MTKRIFRSVFLTAFAVMLACIALIVGALYSYFPPGRRPSSPRRRASPPRASRPTAWTISKPWAAATACASPG